MVERGGSGGSGVDSIAPLYQRLPKGPHRLAREEVSRHQRIRMHGAMVQAIALHGYRRTSVRQVVGLAGVSRRAFYEQFANKEECFLATFDLIAARYTKRVSEAYRSAEGDFQDQMRAAFAAFADEIETNPKEARLVAVDAQTIGTPGMLALRRTSAAFERMLAGSFTHTDTAISVPRPVIRAIVGGLHRATLLRLRDHRTGEFSAMADDMLNWTLLFQTAELGDLDNGPWSRTLLPARSPISANPKDPRDVRARVMQTVLELAVNEDYQELSAPRIADEAGIAVEAFFDLFEDRDSCFLAALDRLSDDLLDTLSDPELDSPGWSRAVHGAVAALMSYLAANPIYAETIAMSAFAAGPLAIERTNELVGQITAALTSGAPDCPGEVIQEAIAGAIWHTIHCHVASRQTRLLPALSDHLTFVVLAPFLGAQAAAQAVADDPSVADRRAVR
jgi:AcrR family transcriptional regulator